MLRSSPPSWFGLQKATARSPSFLSAALKDKRSRREINTVSVGFHRAELCVRRVSAAGTRCYILHEYIKYLLIFHCEPQMSTCRRCWRERPRSRRGSGFIQDENRANHQGNLHLSHGDTETAAELQHFKLITVNYQISLFCFSSAPSKSSHHRVPCV